MESRLCYQHGGPGLNNNPQGNPSAAPLSQEEAEALLARERQRLNVLQNQIDTRQIDAGLRKVLTPADMEERARILETTLKSRIKALSAMFATELESTKTEITALLAGKERTNILAMIAALQKPLPQKNGAPHRYGTIEAGLDLTRIEMDQRFIRSLIPAFPAAENAIRRVDTALTQLSQQDLRYEVRTIELMNSKQNQKVEKVIGSMAQTTGVLIMLAGALLTGIPAIVHSWNHKELDLKKFTPALLYAAVGTLIASPHLRRQLFSGKEQNTLTDIDATLNNPQFRKICEDYHLQGTAAATVIQKMMEQPSDTKNMAAKMRSKGLSTQGAEKDIEAYIKKMTSDPETQGQLLRMFNDHRFNDLVHILSFTTTPDAKSVILDYIRLGARPYNQQVQQAIHQMKHPDN